MPQSVRHVLGILKFALPATNKQDKGFSKESACITVLSTGKQIQYAYV